MFRSWENKASGSRLKFFTSFHKTSNASQRSTSAALSFSESELPPKVFRTFETNSNFFKSNFCHVSCSHVSADKEYFLCSASFSCRCMYDHATLNYTVNFCPLHFLYVNGSFHHRSSQASKNHEIFTTISDVSERAMCF